MSEPVDRAARIARLRAVHILAAVLTGLAAFFAQSGLQALAIAAAVAVTLILISSLEALRHALATTRENHP